MRSLFEPGAVKVGDKPIGKPAWRGKRRPQWQSDKPDQRALKALARAAAKGVVAV